jgi:hypothetical protein
MRDVHNGPLEVNRGPDAAPAADRGERFAQDRAEIVTTAILQIVCNTLIEGSTATAPLWRASATRSHPFYATNSATPRAPSLTKFVWTTSECRPSRQMTRNREGNEYGQAR